MPTLRPRARRPLLIAASLALAAPLALAMLDGPEKEAVQSLKQASKALLETYRAELKAIRITLLPKLEQAGDTLGQTFDGLAFSDLVGDLVELQRDLFEATTEATGSLRAQAFFALSDLGDAEGATLGGLYPKDFYRRSGGRADQTLAAIERALFAEIAFVEQRLTSLQKKAARNGVALGFFLERHPELYEGVWNETGASTPGDYFSTLDIVAAGSDMTVPDDGFLVFAGWINGDLPVEVQVVGPESTQSTVVMPSQGRWSAGLAFLPEGNYMVQARPANTGVQWHWKVVSIR